MTDSLRDKLRALAEHGTGTDLNPTRLCIDPDADMWWCIYLRRLDDQWRARITATLDAEGQDEDGAPEGQPEGSERCARCGKDVTGTPWLDTDEWGASHYCIRCLHGAPPGESDRYRAAPAPVPDDEAESVETLLDHLTALADSSDDAGYGTLSTSVVHEYVDLIGSAHAAAVREAVREHRIEWADYIDHWSGAVGATPPTVESIVAALRRDDPPFGRIAREVAAGGGE